MYTVMDSWFRETEVEEMKGKWMKIKNSRNASEKWNRLQVKNYNSNGSIFNNGGLK